MVALLQLQSLVHGMEPNVGRRPEFAPTLESNLEEIGIQGFGALHSNHPVSESPASPIFPGTVKVTSGIACGPNTLSTMLAPWKHRARHHSPSPVLKSRKNVGGDLIGGFYPAIGFSLVHAFSLSRGSRLVSVRLSLSARVRRHTHRQV